MKSFTEQVAEMHAQKELLKNYDYQIEQARIMVYEAIDKKIELYKDKSNAAFTVNDYAANKSFVLSFMRYSQSFNTKVAVSGLIVGGAWVFLNRKSTLTKKESLRSVLDKCAYLLYEKQYETFLSKYTGK